MDPRANHKNGDKLSFPILEFDADRDALINPRVSPVPAGLPDRAVLCFFNDVLTQLAQAGRLTVVTHLQTEIGRHPIYELQQAGERLLVLHPGVGAPLAAGLLEGVIAMGCRAVVACGGAGAVQAALTTGHIVVPTAAVRDEGTSYHYLPPSRDVDADPQCIAVVEAVLRGRGLPYLLGKTWTTDAFYRETRARIAARRAEGCVVVEMEAASFFAVARFRGIRFAQLLYAGDDVSGPEWDSREWSTHTVRETLFWLAVESCLALPTG